MIHDPRRRHPGAAGSTAWAAPSTTAGVPAESTASPRVDARDVLAASTFMPLLYGIASLVPEAGLWGLHLGGFLRPGIGALPHRHGNGTEE